MKELKPLTYRVNYHEIEAVQVTKDIDTLYQIAEWCGGSVQQEWTGWQKEYIILVPNVIALLKVYEGDYIIRRGNRFAALSERDFHNEYSVKNFTITYTDNRIETELKDLSDEEVLEIIESAIGTNEHNR